MVETRLKQIQLNQIITSTGLSQQLIISKPYNPSIERELLQTPLLEISKKRASTVGVSMEMILLRKDIYSWYSINKRLNAIVQKKISIGSFKGSYE
ncbi:hypothetical protein Q0N12_18195 [Rossellomorea marisflavi]|uniref:hypothetical protein n=1 Tax=Rossellomorea marisflavi TaxID=189381 RepID=UPI00345940D6